MVDGKVELIPEVGAALEVFTDAGLMAGELRRGVRRHAAAAHGRAGVFAWFKAANVGTSAYPFLTMGNAHLLLAHGSPEQIDTYVAAEARGPLVRHDGAVRAAGRLVAGRHHHPGRARRTTAATG